ncbi:hypothetical protein U9R90_05500 [Streptomyces sp. E11-3]|uniref:hypothetical protein n=1 Tax=Streptomyces sp. E11-3 TaxID=3110112 RepID=UPI00398113F2
MTEPLMPDREAEIRETHPGAWYDGPWVQGYVEAAGDEPAYCRVVHLESGTVLATLPDFAGDIALFIADAHDAVPELLAELDRARGERDENRRYAAQLEAALCQCRPECEDGEYLHCVDCPVVEIQMRGDCPGFEGNPVAPDLCAGCGEPGDSHKGGAS